MAQWLRRGAGGHDFQAGKIALIGWDPTSRQVTLLLRQFQKPMGVALARPRAGS